MHALATLTPSVVNQSFSTAESAGIKFDLHQANRNERKFSYQISEGMSHYKKKLYYGQPIN
jgi:hypothetical protein